MENMKFKLQEKLKHKFSLFMEVSIDGAKIYLMPVTSDIPKIKTVEYDIKKDVLEILFESTAHLNYEKKHDDVIDFIREDSGNLIGFRLFQLKKISNKKLVDITIKIMDEDYKKISLKEKSNHLLKEIINCNYEKRKLSFFKEIVKTNMKDLVYI
jgi:hypothetical protein